jgi:hypothetical protein
MTTDLDETRLQVLFLPVNIYIEDTIVVCILNTKQKNIRFFYREINLINIYQMEVYNYLV